MSGQPQRRRQRAERLQGVLQYIEDHLGERLDIATLAAIARTSPFHFHRLFSESVGETVSAYVRRLRLERGLRVLLLGQASITEAAAGSGYATAAGFARAFRRHFERNPTDMVRELLRQRGTHRGERDALPREPRYMELPPLRLLGVQKSGPYPAARRDAWATLDRALAACGASCSDMVQLGIPLDWPEITPSVHLRYQACVVSPLEPGAGLFRRLAGGGSYAVFRYEGACDRLQQVHETIFRNWSPPAGVVLGEGPSLHRYLEPVATADVPVRLHVDIHIPVRRAAHLVAA